MANPQLLTEDVSALFRSLPSADAARAELERRRGGRYVNTFPDVGPYRRQLYPKHIAFLNAGSKHRERLLLKANRVGGTRCGAFEATAHATGRYPHWWRGKRFNHAVDCWVAGDTSESTRDILQLELCGPIGQPGLQGTGMLPADTIYHTTVGKISDSFETIYVRHTSGDLSQITFKSFTQGRKLFQGTAKHFVWLDEECPIDVYEECLLRTMETGEFAGGIIMLTFTPLSGLTPLVLSYLPGGQLEGLEEHDGQPH